MTTPQLSYIKPGRYVVAVSGGVDSMVLLDLLRRQTGSELIVAHFDHGMRTDSAKDRVFVEHFATSHNIEFVYDTGHLGPRASEATARTARYNFLRHTCKNYNALAIITAHHQDDLLETAIINLLRGTGRRGLNSLATHNELLRPLLSSCKAQLLAYAKARGLSWREDPTNQDQTYLRNYVRHQLMPKLPETTRRTLTKIIVRQNQLNITIDAQLTSITTDFMQSTPAPAPLLPRYQFVMWPTRVAYEIFQHVCKQLTGNTLEQDLAKKALLFIKTAKPQKRFLLGELWQLRADTRVVIVEPRDA